jgi:signal peptidase
MHQKKEKTSTAHKIQTVIGIVLCVILIPILILNISLIIRSFTDPDEVPSVGGYLPLIVLTDSMYPQIQSGDLIICHTAQPEDIQVGDVIAFFDPAGNGTSVVTHKVMELTEVGGEVAWVTQGIANNAADFLPVPAKNLVGVYESRISGLGNVVMFMQSTTGLIVCVVLPILLLVGYDILRRRKYEKAQRQDTDALLKELEELRAQKAKMEQTEE